MGGRGDVSRKKTKPISLKCVFQKPYRISIGPTKHVLHLVWSVLDISTAIWIALNVALYDCFDGPLAPLNGQFMAKVNYYNKTKQINFLMGLSVIFFANQIFNFQIKLGGTFFPGGGGRLS